MTEHKLVPQVDFDKMKDRDEVVYKDTKCSESLYEHEKLSLIRKKERGILQFGKSVIERDTKVILEPLNTIQPCNCRNPNRFNLKDHS